MNDWTGARCTEPDVDPNVWLSDAAEADPKLAAALCEGCPLLTACDNYWRTIETGTRQNRAGIYAGKTPARRAAETRRGNRGKALPDHIREAARAGYAAGRPLTDVADELGIHFTTVSSLSADLRHVRQQAQEVSA